MFFLHFNFFFCSFFLVHLYPLKNARRNEFFVGIQSISKTLCVCVCSWILTLVSEIPNVVAGATTNARTHHVMWRKGLRDLSMIQALSSPHTKASTLIKAHTCCGLPPPPSCRIRASPPPPRRRRWLITIKTWSTTQSCWMATWAVQIVVEQRRRSSSWASLLLL